MFGLFSTLAAVGDAPEGKSERSCFLSLTTTSALMAEISEEETINIANNFLLSSPPGEFLEVAIGKSVPSLRRIIKYTNFDYSLSILLIFCGRCPCSAT